jgi:hypothetical protein
MVGVELTDVNNPKGSANCRWIYEISLATEVLVAMVGVIGVAVYARFARNGPRSISEIKGEE